MLHRKVSDYDNGRILVAVEINPSCKFAIALFFVKFA